MPRKSRRVAARQTQKRQKKRRPAKKDITPLPQASLTPTTRQDEAVASPPQAPSPEAEARPQKVTRTQAISGPSVYEFVFPELRRIGGMVALIAIALAVLTVFLR